MLLDTSELDGRLFDGFSDTSKKRYIFVCNMKTNVSRWSKAAVEYFGLPGEYMEQAENFWRPLIHPDNLTAFNEEIGEIFAGRKKRHDMDYRVKNSMGEYITVSCHGVVIPAEENKPALFMGIIENHGILDNIDGITGLYNVYEFHNYINEVNTGKKRISVMFLGVGRFSEINDAYGYVFGTQVLKTVSTLLLHAVRPLGKIFKMNAMHFACVFENKSKEEIEGFYYDVRQLLKNDIFVDGVNLSLVCCAGVVFDCRQYDDFAIRTSGKYALSQSKRDSHGQICYFDDSLLGDNERNLNLIRELRKSVLEGCEGFTLHYQPIVLANGEVLEGSEALLRYNSPTLGMVPPGVFIPWLEKDPCFYELGLWILKNAIKDMKPMVDQYPDFVLNVNIAYPQFSNPDFKFEVVRILENYGFPPRNLCLELTERCRQLDKTYLRAEVSYLKSQGIRIALDDFGTGFSSLNLLRELPIDIIKIDKDFISDIIQNRVNQSIVKAITTCAKDLSILVCVEGLEEREMIEFIKKYRINSLQGYFFSKPIPLVDFLAKYLK